MEMQPVTSSAITHVGYDPAASELVIQFKGGKTHSYANVPPEVHQGLVSAQSIGKHFSDHIRDKYKSTKL